MPVMKDGIRFAPPVNRRGAEKTRNAVAVTLHETNTIKGDEKMTAKKATTNKKPKPQGSPKMLKKVRMDAGMSIYSLADHMKVTPSTISYWENGIKHPRHDKIMKLEDLFNTNYRELFEDLSDEDARELRDKVNSPMK